MLFILTFFESNNRNRDKVKQHFFRRHKVKVLENWQYRLVNLGFRGYKLTKGNAKVVSRLAIGNRLLAIGSVNWI